MSREEAIEQLKELIEHLKNDMYADDKKALEMAIQALSQEPTVDEMEREYEKSKALFHKIVECDDAISREELLKAIDTWDKFGCDANTKLVPYQDHYIPYIHYDDVIKCIKGMPPVTPKSGKWTLMYEPKNMVVCSECGKCAYMYQNKTSAFCPHCGAKMESEVRNENQRL